MNSAPRRRSPAAPTVHSAGFPRVVPAGPRAAGEPDEAGQTGVSVLETPDVADVPVEDKPWVVIVWNDPINLMSYVTFVLQKLFGYSLEKATELMLDVHEKGKAVVASDGRERAEMHVFRLHEHGLWATLEHDQ